MAQIDSCEVRHTKTVSCMGLFVKRNAKQIKCGEYIGQYTGVIKKKRRAHIVPCLDRGKMQKRKALATYLIQVRGGIFSASLTTVAIQIVNLINLK